jgi:uncharacterized protein with von Willebrand factor type A (vWA) domain
MKVGRRIKMDYYIAVALDHFYEDYEYYDTDRQNSRCEFDKKIRKASTSRLLEMERKLLKEREAYRRFYARRAESKGYKYHMRGSQDWKCRMINNLLVDRGFRSKAI